jgi:hypothetical protein
MDLTAQGVQELKKLGKFKFDGLRTAIESLDDKEIENLRRLVQKAAGNYLREADG